MKSWVQSYIEFLVKNSKLIVNDLPLGWSIHMISIDYETQTIKKLPLVNVFDTPYELWSFRKPTPEEIKNHSKVYKYFLTEVKDKLLEKINDHFSAAKYIALKGFDNAFENHINNCLNNSNEINDWIGKMPSILPEALYFYKKTYPEYNLEEVCKAINDIGVTLSQGQFVFHGGYFNNLGTYFTDKPLSTSLCPQVALRSAEWNGKAYDIGQIDLMVIKVKSPISKVFFFNLDQTLGNEKEVLFAPCARLNIIKKHLIVEKYTVFKVDEDSTKLKKDIPLYIVEAEIS